MDINNITYLLRMKWSRELQCKNIYNDGKTEWSRLLSFTLAHTLCVTSQMKIAKELFWEKIWQIPIISAIFLQNGFCNTSQVSCIISIVCGARLSRCYSFLNPFQRIIHDADNEPDEYGRICKQIFGGTNWKWNAARYERVE